MTRRRLIFVVGFLALFGGAALADNLLVQKADGTHALPMNGNDTYILGRAANAPIWIAPPSGTPSFSAITTGTNTGATMTCGTGCTITTSGSGTNAATTAAKWLTARNLAGNSVDGSGNVAFGNAFVVQGTADSGLSGAQFLGALATGIVKVTTTTGVLSTAVAADFPTLNQSTTGNAATATALQTARTINGTSFDGTGNITVTAAAGTLTGATLNATVTGSSLTSVGTIGSGTWNGTTIAVTSGGTGLASTTVNQILYSSAANTIMGLATASNGVLITSGAGVPSISSALPNATQDNITRLGTIANVGASIGVAYGGTGDATLASNGVLYGNGTGAVQTTAQGGTNTILVASAGAPSFSATPIINTSVQLGVVSSTTGALKLANSASANLTTIQAGNAASARTYTWPTDLGAAGTVLTDAAGNGTLSWAAAAGGDTITSPNSTLTVGGTATNTTLDFNTAKANLVWTANGALSAPVVTWNGTWITGGTSTTTKPAILIETTGATSTAWSISGTGFGVNAASGFTGNLVDFQVAGLSQFKVSSAGSATASLSTIGQPVNNFAGFSHSSNFTQTGYALLQGASGDTYINAASSQLITTRNSNTTVGTAGGLGWMWTFNTNVFPVTGAETTLFNFNSSPAINWPTGAVTTTRTSRFQRPDFHFAGASVVTTGINVAVEGAPTVDTNATITNPIALQVGGATTQLTTSNASMFYRAVDLTAHTVTLNGSTNLTATNTGGQAVFAPVTYSAASALTISNSYTVDITGPSAGAGAGPATITNAGSLLVRSGAVNLADATISQATNVNTGVTVNGATVVITTQSASTAAATCETGFTVTNSAVLTGSSVVCHISDYSGARFTNGVPNVMLDTIAAGSFHLKICNDDMRLASATALSGTMKIHCHAL